MLRLITKTCSYGTSSCLCFDHIAVKCNFKLCIMVNWFVGNILAVLGHWSCTLYQLIFDKLEIMTQEVKLCFLLAFHLRQIITCVTWWDSWKVVHKMNYLFKLITPLSFHIKYISKEKVELYPTMNIYKYIYNMY